MLFLWSGMIPTSSNMYGYFPSFLFVIHGTAASSCSEFHGDDYFSIHDLGWLSPVTTTSPDIWCDGYLGCLWSSKPPAKIRESVIRIISTYQHPRISTRWFHSNSTHLTTTIADGSQNVLATLLSESCLAGPLKEPKLGKNWHVVKSSP